MIEHLSERIEIQCQLDAVICLQFTTNGYGRKALNAPLLNLQLYVQIGLIVERVQRVLQFLQENGMEPYIRLNTQKKNRPPGINSKKILSNL